MTRPVFSWILLNYRVCNSTVIEVDDRKLETKVKAGIVLMVLMEIKYFVSIEELNGDQS